MFEFTVAIVKPINFIDPELGPEPHLYVELILLASYRRYQFSTAPASAGIRMHSYLIPCNIPRTS